MPFGKIPITIVREKNLLKCPYLVSLEIHHSIDVEIEDLCLTSPSSVHHSLEDGHTAEAKEMFPLETAPPPQPPYTSWRPESRLGFSEADEARSRPEVGSRLIPGPGPSLPQLSSEPEQVLF